MSGFPVTSCARCLLEFACTQRSCVARSMFVLCRGGGAARSLIFGHLSQGQITRRVASATSSRNVSANDSTNACVAKQIEPYAARSGRPQSTRLARILPTLRCASRIKPMHSSERRRVSHRPRSSSLPRQLQTCAPPHRQPPGRRRQFDRCIECFRRDQRASARMRSL